MSYSSGSAFRRALENQLLAQSREFGVALVRLRKLVAFDRPSLLAGRREAARGLAGHVRGARSGGVAVAPA